MSQTQNESTPETAETKVRRALAASPGGTTANLANAAGVGRSTASKLLSRWASEGWVARNAGKDQSVPVTWTMHDDQTDEPVEDADAGDHATTVTKPDEDASTDDNTEHEADSTLAPGSDAKNVPGPAESDTPGTAVPNKDRLPKGGLYELVKAFLYEHPGESFGPAKIGTVLGRSSGAVNNALEKLATQGLAKKTCDAPKRFSSS